MGVLYLAIGITVCTASPTVTCAMRNDGLVDLSFKTISTGTIRLAGFSVGI